MSGDEFDLDLSGLDEDTPGDENAPGRGTGGAQTSNDRAGDGLGSSGSNVPPGAGGGPDAADDEAERLRREELLRLVTDWPGYKHGVPGERIEFACPVCQRAEAAFWPRSGTLSCPSKCGPDFIAEALRTETPTEDPGPGGERDLVPVLLDEFLATEDEPLCYRVDRLWPVGGRVVLAAQYKAGKTTLRDNLVRVLADGGKFLDRFEVDPPDGRVVIIDNELDERMMRRWLREQGIARPDRVAVLPLRGRVGAFDLIDPAARSRWADRLRAVDAQVVVFDCLRPVLDALGLDENREAGRFLVAFDALLDEAGAAEGALVHHMGHNGERSRGDSRILDWPDVTWRMIRERGENGESDPHARRFFSAYGRDVDVPEGLLTFERDRRRLVFTGGGRKDEEAEEALPDILDYLTRHPGSSGRAIEKVLTVTHTRAQVRRALRLGVERGEIVVKEGRGTAKLHYVADAPEGAE